MPLVTAAILPHGGGLIPGFEEAKGDYRMLRNAVAVCSKIILDTKPDTLIIASPHNIRLHSHIGVIFAERLAGTLAQGRRRIRVERTTDRVLAKKIYSNAVRSSLPAVLVNYGTDSGPASLMPLDWGSIIPLHFLDGVKNTVLVTPSREIPWSSLVKFGRCINAASTKSPKRIAFVSSADQAHAHSKEGPYGYDVAAGRYDRLIEQLIEQERLDRLERLNPRLVERAKPDSLWQMLILAGSMEGLRLKLKYLKYDCPSYFGMLAAVFS